MYVHMIRRSHTTRSVCTSYVCMYIHTYCDSLQYLVYIDLALCDQSVHTCTYIRRYIHVHTYGGVCTVCMYIHMHMYQILLYSTPP